MMMATIQSTEYQNRTSPSDSDQSGVWSPESDLWSLVKTFDQIRRPQQITGLINA